MIALTGDGECMMFRIVHNNVTLPCFLPKVEFAQGQKQMMMKTTSMNIKQVAANRPKIMPTPEEIRKSELGKSICLYVLLVYIFSFS